MPIIPRADESQVLNAGSPVPISGTGEAGLFSRATDQLGEAMMKVGASLNTVEKALTKERAKLDADESVYDFSTQLVKVEHEVKSDPKYMKDDPSKMLDLYKEKARAIMQNYSSGMEGDNNRKAFFSAGASKLIAEGAINFYAGAIKDYTGAHKDKLADMLSRRASIVADSVGSSEKVVSEKLNDALASISNLVKNDTILTNDEKIEFHRKAKKELINSYVNGHVIKIEQSKSLEQRQALEQSALRIFNFEWTLTDRDIPIEGTDAAIRVKVPRQKFGAPGVLNEDEKLELVKRVTNAKYHADQRQQAEINMLESLDSKRNKKLMAENFRRYSALVLTAPHEAKPAIMESMKRDAVNGELDPQRIDDIIKLGENMFIPTGPVATEQDKKYRIEFMDKVVGSDDPTSLVNEPLLNSVRISPHERLGLSDAAERMGNAFRKNPGLKQSIKAGINSFGSYKNDPNYKYLGNKTRRSLEEAEANAKSKFYQAIMANPDTDIDKLSKDLYEREIVPNIEVFKGTSIDVKNNLQNLLQQRDSIAEQWRQSEKNGTMSLEKSRELKRKILEVNQAIKKAGGE